MDMMRKPPRVSRSPTSTIMPAPTMLPILQKIASNAIEHEACATIILKRKARGSGPRLRGTDKNTVAQGDERGYKTQIKRRKTHLEVFLPVAISAAHPYEPLCSQT